MNPFFSSINSCNCRCDQGRVDKQYNGGQSRPFRQHDRIMLHFRNTPRISIRESLKIYAAAISMYTCQYV
jgi:hypothetical protein